MDIQLNSVSYYAGYNATAVATLGTSASIEFSKPIDKITEKELRELLKACRKARMAYKAAYEAEPDEFDDRD